MYVSILQRWVRQFWPRSLGRGKAALDNLLAPVAGADYFDELLEVWSWLIHHNVKPLVVTAFGDVFLVTQGGSVLFLDTAGGTCVEVAASVDEWQEKIHQRKWRNEWFMPDFLEQLRRSGKHLLEGECYSPLHSPCLGGAFTVDNWQPTSWRVHVAFSGSLHATVKDLPPGTKVTGIKFTPL